MFLISLILVLSSSYFITSCITKKNTGILYFFLLCFAQIVLTFEILSFLSCINEITFLIINIVIFLVSTILVLKKKSLFVPQGFKEEIKKIKNSINIDKTFKWLSIFFIFFLVCELISAIFLPISFGDALTYYLPRCTSWLQNGNINHFITPDTRELIMPVNMEFLYSWVLLFRKSEFGISIFSYLSFLGANYLIYNLLGEIGFCIRKRLWSIFTFSSLALVGIMAYTPCADLFIGSLILCAIYLFLLHIKHNDKTALYFSTLSLALAIGTKTTAIITLPSIIIIFAVLTLKYKKNYLVKTVLLYSLLLVLNFLIFSSYNYILNFLSFSNPISCSEQLLINKFQGSIKGYLCTVIKYFFAIFDFSGVNNFEFYNSFISNLKTKTLSLIGETQNSYMSKFFPENFEFNENMSMLTSGLGAIGLMCFIPALIRSTKSLSDKKIILFLFGSTFIFNVLLFSRIMIYTSYNLRYLLTFVVIASPILALSYIKSNKNIFKWIIFFLMFNYLVLNAYSKPFQYFLQHKEENGASYKIAQEAKIDEKKIYDFFRQKEKTTIALIAYSKEADLYSIEKLKLQGYKIEKILAEDINIYDLTEYEYIIANEYKISSTNIKHTNNQSCNYIDNMKVDCLIPFEHFKTNGFQEIKTPKFNNYKILERNLIH